METVKRQTRTAYGWLFGHRSKSRGCGLSLQPIGCTPALSVTQQRRCSCSCRLWHKCYALNNDSTCLYNKFAAKTDRVNTEKASAVLALWRSTYSVATVILRRWMAYLCGRADVGVSTHAIRTCSRFASIVSRRSSRIVGDEFECPSEYQSATYWPLYSHQPAGARKPFFNRRGVKVKNQLFHVTRYADFHPTLERIVLVWISLPTSVNFVSLSDFKNSLLRVELTQFLKCT